MANPTRILVILPNGQKAYVPLPSGASPEEIATAVQNYLNEHPIAPAEQGLTIEEVKADIEIASVISLKHSPGSDNQDLSGFQLKEIGKGLSENNLTTSLKTAYDGAVTHSTSPSHAPAGATTLSGYGIIDGCMNNDSRLSDARTPLAHSHPNPSWSSGIAIKNITDASTVQNIAHGLGRIPKYVRIDGAIIITAAISQLVTGVFDGTNNRGLTVAIGEGTSTAATDAVYTSTSIALGFSPLVATNPFTGANRQTGIITADATNIIITWTKTGTVASLTASLIWQCT